MKKILLTICILLICSQAYAVELILQQGLDSYAGCEDTKLNPSAATTNYGSDEDLSNNGNTDAKWIFIFDLSGIPAGATIDSAQFEFYQWVRGHQHTLDLQGLLRVFVESEATWNIWKTSNNWTTAGADSDGNDYDSTPTINVANQNGGWVSWSGADVVSLVESIIATTNSGFIVSAPGGQAYDSFYSSEYTTNTTLRPKLTINYTAAAGGRTRRFF